MLNQCADDLDGNIVPQKRKRENIITKNESLTPLLKKTVPTDG